MIIGICGKSGCGKSTLAKQIIELSNKESVHLEIDKVGHKVLLFPEVKSELIKCFGDLIAKENTINRKKLGQLVFNSKDKMDKLTYITWKYMQIEIDEFLKNNKGKIIILDWLLLPKSKYFSLCDIKILLDVPYEIRKQRAIKRDNITEEAFDLREMSSIDYDENNFDYVFKTIDNEIVRKMVKNL